MLLKAAGHIAGHIHSFAEANKHVTSTSCGLRIFMVWKAIFTSLLYLIDEQHVFIGSVLNVLLSDNIHLDTSKVLSFSRSQYKHFSTDLENPTFIILNPCNNYVLFVSFVFIV